MKNLKEYKTTGEWHEDARKEGYNFPNAMCHGLDIGQKALELSFGEVFELFVKHEVIIEVDHGFIYYMRGHFNVKI